MRIYSYLRANTDDQDATRAKAVLETFVNNKGFRVSGWFIENVSGAQLKRPELFRLLELAEDGDIILVEQIDRISRLDKTDWERFKSIILEKGIRIVSLDLPTSFQMLNKNSQTDDFTGRMLDAINSMLMDMLASVARKDYQDRRRRQNEGIKANKEKFRGRQVDKDKRKAIKAHLKSGMTYGEIQAVLPCSRSTISRVKKEIKKEG